MLRREQEGQGHSYEPVIIFDEAAWLLAHLFLKV